MGGDWLEQTHHLELALGFKLLVDLAEAGGAAAVAIAGRQVRAAARHHGHELRALRRKGSASEHVARRGGGTDGALAGTGPIGVHDHLSWPWQGRVVDVKVHEDGRESSVASRRVVASREGTHGRTGAS